MKQLNRQQIISIVSQLDLISPIENGFIQYSRGQVVIPPVGELLLDKGEVHIKYGYVKADDYYVIKIASGFYKNPEIGLSSSNGLMLLFNQQTGELVCNLMDEGYLTDIRTAIAGAICAKYLAPKKITAIGIIGTGIQARLQAIYLKTVTRCRHIVVWGRNKVKLDEYQCYMQEQGFSVMISNSIEELAQHANLIISTTPATSPILKAEYLKPGTHITAVGSDTAEKQELAVDILAMADLVVADSFHQCQQRGEIFHALTNNKISKGDITELGNIIAKGQGRMDDNQVTIADLTGLAIQDIKIAEAVYFSSNEKDE
jgi:ornithine cyclodeaminase